MWQAGSKWRAIRDEINREVCEQGYDSVRGAFMQYYGAAELDASVLLISDVGFLPADDPRVVSTMKVLQRDLMAGRLLAATPRSIGADRGMSAGACRAKRFGFP